MVCQVLTVTQVKTDRAVIPVLLAGKVHVVTQAGKEIGRDLHELLPIIFMTSRVGYLKV